MKISILDLSCSLSRPFKRKTLYKLAKPLVPWSFWWDSCFCSSPGHLTRFQTTAYSHTSHLRETFLDFPLCGMFLASCTHLQTHTEVGIVTRMNHCTVLKATFAKTSGEKRTVHAAAHCFQGRHCLHGFNFFSSAYCLVISRTLLGRSRTHFWIIPHS